uniref:RNA polymerase sigma factor n=1 Tax=Agathobacter sp. TaxID=2021311 RepID=UPI0040564B74
MEDREIIELFWNRTDMAISVADKKYHSYCQCIAYNILGNKEDAEECLNDTWMKAWNTIPPQNPTNLAAFLGKITRNTALNYRRDKYRKRRSSGQMDLVLEELEECVSYAKTVEQEIAEKELAKIINHFLGTLPELERNVFVCRYWRLEPISQIAAYAHSGESKIKSMLFRIRKKLKKHLEKEGYDV